MPGAPVLLLQRRLCWAVLGEAEAGQGGEQCFWHPVLCWKGFHGQALFFKTLACEWQRCDSRNASSARTDRSSVTGRQLQVQTVHLFSWSPSDWASLPPQGLVCRELKTSRRKFTFSRREFLFRKNHRQVGSCFENPPRLKPMHLLEGTPSESGT